MHELKFLGYALVIVDLKSPLQIFHVFATVPDIQDPYLIVLLIGHMLGLYIVEGIKQNRDPFSFARAENNGRNIYLSRHKLLEQVQQKARKKFSNSLTVGTVVTGTVTCLMPCGAFIELIPVVEGWCTFRN